jgi:hypothetical protein
MKRVSFNGDRGSAGISGAYTGAAGPRSSPSQGPPNSHGFGTGIPGPSATGAGHNISVDVPVNDFLVSGSLLWLTCNKSNIVVVVTAFRRTSPHGCRPASQLRRVAPML